MIDAELVLTYARYNAWQNGQMRKAMAKLDAAALRADRGAFFGSILATANHVLWADLLWMHRLAGQEDPGGQIAESVNFRPDLETWELDRFRCDAAILIWAEGLRSVDLAGMLRTYSFALGRDVERPRGLCVLHMFNHQTHHRGQIHAMLTQAGVEAPVSDLPFMPEEGPWL